jgi:phosphatidylserine/phosphatidylglycerophosphate/cardiolipin synthase-like enzyme
LLEVRTLTDGGQTALAVAVEVAAFLDGARSTLDLALYDLRLDGAEAQPVARAIEEAQDRGVAVRILYNVDHPGPIPVPPPSQAVPDLIEALPVSTRAVPGIPDLMHHKYAVRDGEAVLTGSANWTEDSWTRQENLFAQVESVEIASDYLEDFEQLWTSLDVASSGQVEPDVHRVGDARVRAWFTPGFGEALAQRIADAIGRSRMRVRICSPVITSGPVLGTLAQVVSDRRVDATGVVDLTQVRQVIAQWHENGNAAWKVPLLEAVLDRGKFAGKRSTLWSPDSVHDFMHAKLTVADDTVFLGSYNLSRSGELNAENVLEIEDADLGDRLAGYVDEVRARYPAADLSSPRPAPS